VEGLNFQERSAYVVDYSRRALDSLAVGHGQLVHAGWIHSHSARLGSRCDFDPPDPGQKPSRLTRQARRIVERGIVALKQIH
jgi:hypothetical protein